MNCFSLPTANRLLPTYLSGYELKGLFLTFAPFYHELLTMSHELKWKKLSSHYIHKGPWATLRVDRCEMPDGRIVEDYYVLEYPNWVNAVALTEDNKIVMVHQYRHAAGIVSLEIPGGVIEDGESPVCEVYANPSTANNYTSCYLARNGKKVQDQQFDDHEELIVETFTIDEVKQLLADNKIAQALHCTGLFYALAKLEKE
jgi:ADP-ribose pyrophosphatase